MRLPGSLSARPGPRGCDRARDDAIITARDPEMGERLRPVAGRVP